MVILITGASHVGKTLLAQKMLEKYKYPYLSIEVSVSVDRPSEDGPYSLRIY